MLKVSRGSQGSPRSDYRVSSRVTSLPAHFSVVVTLTRSVWSLFPGVPLVFQERMLRPSWPLQVSRPVQVSEICIYFLWDHAASSALVTSLLPDLVSNEQKFHEVSCVWHMAACPPQELVLVHGLPIYYCTVRGGRCSTPALTLISFPGFNF